MHCYTLHDDLCCFWGLGRCILQIVQFHVYTYHEIICLANRAYFQGKYLRQTTLEDIVCTPDEDQRGEQIPMYVLIH